MTLEELIDQQINLGHKDPHQFPDLLRKAVGDDLTPIVAPYLDDFITELGRQRINAQRRTALAKITPHAITSRELMLKSMWVPRANGDDPLDVYYKPVGDMTAADFDSRATYLERMAGGILAHARWCRACAHQIRTENVKTFGKVKNIPELPETVELS